jgi:hypothetical protein
MDSFGSVYVQQNLPLIFLSGAGGDDDDVVTDSALRPLDGGFRIRTELPVIDTTLAHTVRDALFEYDGTQQSWKSAGSQTRSVAIRNVGRACPTLPTALMPVADDPAGFHVTAAKGPSSTALSSSICSR